MSNPLKPPRATTTSATTRVLEDAEMVYDTTLDRLRIGDGVTYGGLVQAAAGDIMRDAVATYAELTALTAATGLLDNAVYCTYGRTGEEDGGFGFWRYDSASTATADGGIILAIDGGGAGRFFRIYDGDINVFWYGTDAAAVQSALTLGRRVFLPPGTIALGNTILSPATGSHLYGVPGKSILSKTTTGATNYTKPFFDILDVTDVTIEGITGDFNTGSLEELFAHVRATTLGATKRVTIRNCKLLNCWVWVQRYVDGCDIVANEFDGENTGFAGVAMGGVFVNGLHDPAGNEATYGGGPVRNVRVIGNNFHDIDTEAVDVNWYAEHILIADNTITDADEDGGNSIIDVGSNDSDDTQVSRDVVVRGNLIEITASGQNSRGIEVKRDITGVVVSGNVIRSANTAGSTSIGIDLTNAVDAAVTGNVIDGFKYGIYSTGDATGTDVMIDGNTITGFGLEGILLDTTVETTVSNNTISTAVSGADYGIRVMSSAGTAYRNQVLGNRVNGVDTAGIEVSSSAVGTLVSGNECYANLGASARGFNLVGAYTQTIGNKAHGNGTHGFNINGDYHLIEGNQAYDNGITTTGYGFVLNNGCDYLSLIGNKAFDTRAGGSRTQLIGYIAVTSCPYAVVVGNHSRNHPTSEISGFAAFATDATMTGNKFGDVAEYATVNTDAAFALTPFTSAPEQRHTGVLTADRAVTLTTTNAVAGVTRFRITRTGGGAFNLNVGTGPLKALATNTWCEVAFDGSAYYLAAYGAL